MIQTILQIANFNGKLSAFVRLGDPIPIHAITGSPHVGSEIDDVSCTVVTNTVDPDCINGVCDLKMPEGK